MSVKPPQNPAPAKPTNASPVTGVPPRRNFLTAAAAAVIGAIVGLVPLVSGLWVFADPLRKKSAAGKFVRVAALDSISTQPQLFQVIADKVDAWNLYPQVPIGAVYIRRLDTDPNQFQVLNATCPHAGCAVSFTKESDKFLCPCHNSAFEVNGETIDPCASPRRLDELTWKIEDEKGQKSLWVEFQNFHTGREEKKVKA